MRTLLAVLGSALIVSGFLPVALSFIFPSIALFTIGLCLWAVGLAVIAFAILLRLVQ